MRWKTARRLVAKVEHHADELLPRMGFPVTNLTLPSRAVVRFYNKRGTAEVAAATTKEGKQAVKMTRLSCHRFRSNEVPACGRQAAMAERDCLQSGQPGAATGVAEENQRLLADQLAAAVGQDGRLVKHARSYWLLLAESHLTRRLFAAMVWRIERLPLPAP